MVKQLSELGYSAYVICGTIEMTCFLSYLCPLYPITRKRNSQKSYIHVARSVTNYKIEANIGGYLVKAGF